MGRVFLCKACLWESWDVYECVFWALWLRYRSATREREGSCLPTFVTAFACFLRLQEARNIWGCRARWRSWDMWYVITVSALSHYQSAWQYFLLSCFGKKAYALSTNVIWLLSGAHICTHTQTDVHVNHSWSKRTYANLQHEWENMIILSRGWCAYGRSMAC